MQTSNILSKNQLSVAKELSRFSNDFYLAGGTAIALQIGHRKSIDFDLFTEDAIDSQKILQNLESDKLDRILVNSTDELTCIYDQVKITFLRYPFNFDAEIELDFFRTPSLINLAAMKAYTLGRRSKWKDYVDLYFLLKTFTLEQIEEQAEKKFGKLFSKRLFREQLVYFDDIDYTEKVEYIIENAPSDSDVQNKLASIVSKS